ncbi:hypothetical protein [Polyangium sorediatum]|uniref:Uncharacterized protein n=1 Tax=Polyangium sorediatum TaxID=889274 RepID=A0ABT6NSY7_9BACT|nr:hypothetical protein [Polyangium sorediatum]MDI1431418.1 hypothetical protein [Polyangium sorediatum]
MQDQDLQSIKDLLESELNLRVEEAEDMLPADEYEGAPGSWTTLCGSGCPM